jgi:DNA replication protein DnaC
MDTEEMQTSSCKELEYICDKCGQTVYPVALNGKYFEGKCQCEINVIQRKRSEAALQDMEREKIEKRYASSMMSVRFRESTFDRFVNRPGVDKVLKTARDYADTWGEVKETGEGLLIFGGTGNGKSHITAAIANVLIPQGASVVFVNVPDLIQKLKNSFQSDHGTEDIIRSLEEADLLILDDIGAEQWKEWIEATLYTIINNRYNNRKPIVITSNCPYQELRDKVGFRSWSRIQETCLLVENKATDYRRELGRERIERERRKSDE